VRGRAAVLSDVRARLAAGGGVVLAGAAGVGKTTVAREVAADRDARWVVGSPALAAIPLGAVAHLLEGDRPLPGDDPLAAMRAGASALEGAGGDLVVVDDLPLLDGQSLALVQHLVRRGRVPVLATVRDRSAVPYSVRALWQDGDMDVVDVGPLGVADVAEVLDDALDDEVDPGLAERLHRLTGGNALLLREAVDSGRADGSLQQVDGRWAWTGIREPSTGLVDAVRGRLAAVGDVGIEAGDLLAVGAPLPVTALAAIAGQEAVEALETAGVVRIDEDGVVRFAHPLYGEVIAAALGVARRRRLWVALADALEPLAVTRTDLLRVARWRLGGGGHWTSERWLEAAEAASASFDHELGGALARRAIEEGGGWRASMLLVGALHGAKDDEGALRVLAEIEGDAADDDQRREHALALYLSRSARFGFRLDLDEDLRRVEDVVEDPDQRRFLQAQRATLRCWAGDVDGGLRLADRLLAELGDRDDDAAAAVRVRLGTAIGVGQGISGRTREAADHCAAQLPHAIRLADQYPAAPVWCATPLMQNLVAGMWLEDVDAAVEVFRALIEGGDWSEWFRERAADFLTMVVGSVDLARGHIPEAMAGLSPLLDDQLPDELAHWALYRLAEAAASAGEAAIAARAATRLDAVGDAIPVYEEVAVLGHVWAGAAAGSSAAAAELALDAMATAVDRGRFTIATFLGHAASRLGWAEAAYAPMEALVGRCDVATLPLLVEHGRAAAGHDGPGLEAVADGFADAGLLLLAAEALDQARAAHLRDGRPRDAERAAAASATLLQRCGGVRPPWLGIVDAPTPLTRREEEVVKLAAQGLTSSAIAERLFLSTRTVEGHLLRAFPKLGVRSREDLPRLLGTPARDAPGGDGG
jgi:DNA-binding CsgD family transcriptional regulator